MADIRIRTAEGNDPDPFLLWDSVWSPEDGEADWALAGAGEPLNRGGLQARAALATAVTLALFTERRIEPEHPLAWLADGDPRGWWGDGVDVREDLGETALGSRLWVLERAPLTADTERWAREFALESLMPLQEQGAVVRIEADAVANEAKGRLELLVRLYGREGTAIYDRRFELIWKQV